MSDETTMDLSTAGEEISPAVTEAADGGAEALKAALKAERDARRKYEREFKQAAAKLSEYEESQKSDLEKLVAERDRLRELAAEQQAQLRRTQTEAAVRDAAEAAGARNGRLVWKLVKDDLEVDDAGSVANLAAAIAQARKDAPELFGPAGRSDAGKGQGASHTAPTMTDLIRQRAGYTT